ncbi:MAG: hypothetical protein KGL35_06420 [Bradyrhizobium sp.]|nr:hypothetical protein [Bradyrhizobium sp.]
MSVLPSDLVFYGSADMPDVDGSLTGGAVSFSTIVNFNDITPTGTMNYVSTSASDTAATITLTGRDATGVVQTEVKTLTGTTAVAGSQSFERLLKGLTGGTTAVGDVAAISATAVVSGTAQGGAAATSSASATITLAAGQGASCAVGMILHTTGGTGPNQLRRIVAISTDTVSVSRGWGTTPDATTTYTVNHGMLFDLLPSQVTQNRRPFYAAASDVVGGSNRTYYEKLFAVNTNTATALTSAIVSKTADPSGGVTLEFALTNALNDTATVANRQTLPATGITAFTTGASPQSINVPSPQNLPSGATPNAAGAQGVWLSLLIPAGISANKTSFQLQAKGNTT